jgi:hypothetical protein
MLYDRNKNEEVRLELYVLRKYEGWHTQGGGGRDWKRIGIWMALEKQERQKADKEQTSVKQNPTLTRFVYTEKCAPRTSNHITSNPGE